MLFDENDGKVKMMPVEVKRVLKDGEVIVESDLRPGESIVSAGVNDLKEGQVVRVLPPVMSQFHEISILSHEVSFALQSDDNGKVTRSLSQHTAFRSLAV